jgi:hypothetical protein
MAATSYSLEDIKDALLTEVAVRIQLPPSQYQLAIERVNTLANWLDRPDSPLAGFITIVYPQGSMAIHATVASCLVRDEFDIDAIVQIAQIEGWTVDRVLDMLFLAVRGERGSRYYDSTVRHTRCVTVNYSDMHVDLTPAQLIPRRDPRTSFIFHHRPEARNVAGQRVVANPYGFAEWFNATVERNRMFEEAFSRQSIAMDKLYKAAETEDAPDQIPAYQKPPTVVTLQLLKRFRNVRYEPRKERRPPGVLIAKLLADSQSGVSGIFEDLLHRAKQLRASFLAAQARGQLIEVANPVCPEDRFTDRWPAGLSEQNMFLDDLTFLVNELLAIRGEADLARIRVVFGKLFGEKLSEALIESFANRAGARIAGGQLASERGTGRISLGRSALVPGPAVLPERSHARHTFYGAKK